MRTRANNNGFTLLEVIVALGMMAVILSTLYSGFFVAHKAATSTGDSLVRLHEARGALDIIRREIEGAIKPEPGSTQKFPFEVNDRDFYGKQSSSISFTTFASAMPGPAKVSYFVREQGEKLMLMKQLTRAGLSDHDSSPKAEVVEELVSFLIEAKGTDKQWVKTWRETKQPSELKITLEINTGQRDVSLTAIAVPRKGTTP